MTTLIKTDVRSKNDQGVWGFHGAKKHYSEPMGLDELIDFIETENRVGVHELLEAEKYRPYADLDLNAGQMEYEEFEKLKFEKIKSGRDAMERLFPDGDVFTFCASSQTKGKISAHFIVNNIYYKSKAEIRYVLEKGCDMKALHFDHQVYDHNKTMRMPLCSKPGETRPLRYAEVKVLGYIHYPDEDLEADLNCGLITLTEKDDIEMPTPEGFVEKEKKKNEPADAEVLYSQEQKDAQFEKMTRLVKALASNRASLRENWCKGIWAIRRVANTYGQVGAYLSLAQEFAKKTDLNNYNQTDTNTLYDDFKREQGVGYKTLKDWADEDTPDWDATEITINPTDEFSIDVLKEKIKCVKTPEDLQKFSGAVTAYMNSFYTLIKWGRKPFIISSLVKVNEEGEREKHLDYKDVHSMSIDFKNKTIPYKLVDAKKGDVFCPMKCWLEHPQRSEKDRVYFNPREMEDKKFADPKAYNLFDGLAITHKLCEKAETLSPDGAWLQHILKRWAGGDVSLYNSILDKFALQIQKPWIKHGVALGLMSPEGSGKGLVLQPIFNIIGRKYVAIPSTPDQVLGKFNAILEGKLLVFLDELTWGGDKEREGALKRLTTEPMIGLERKGIDPIQIDNPANVVCCSNEDWMAPASKKARRLLLAKLSTELAGRQTKETAAIIQAILDTPILSIAKFFYERDITDFNPKKIVATEALRSQKIESMSPFDAACLSMLNRGQVKINGMDKFISNSTFNKAEFYESVGAPMKYMTDNKFWPKIQELWPSVRFERPMENKKRVQKVVFPELKVLREEFCKMYDDENWVFDDADEDAEDEMGD